VTSLPVAKIWAIASFDARIRAKVALELTASWPIPSQRRMALGFWFFYYASFGPPPALRFTLYPPSWAVWIGAVNGSIWQLRRVRPTQVGLNVREGHPLGAHQWPRDWTIEIADRKREELFESYDNILPMWVRRAERVQGVSAQIRAFRQSFLDLTQPALLPCYRALGESFFSWVGV